MKYRNFYYSRRVKHWLSAPVIYVLIFPFVILDIFMEIYQRICFPIYGLPIIKRGDYIAIDRHKLDYITWLDKLNCMYCGYINGLVVFILKIVGETEKYWCGIKHENKKGFVQPRHHRYFSEYNNQEVFNKKYKIEEKVNSECKLVRKS